MTSDRAGDLRWRSGPATDRYNSAVTLSSVSSNSRRAEPPSTDPTEHLHWAGLRGLLTRMDEDITRLYQDRGIEALRPRFAKPLIKLARCGPMTIRALAEAIDGTHSATSQTVAAMRSAGYVRTTRGTDARTREVTLTEKAAALVPFLEQEWRATEAAVAELDAEVPYPMTQVVADLERALAHRSFADRVAARLSS